LGTIKESLAASGPAMPDFDSSNILLCSSTVILAFSSDLDGGKGKLLRFLSADSPLLVVVSELLRDAELHKLSLLSTMLTKGLCLGLGLEKGFWVLGDKSKGEGIVTANGAFVV
jgi:hypothetical protein